MSNVNLGEKYNKRVTLRLNQSQFDFLISISSDMKISPSDYMRMLLESTMKEVGTNENVKTDLDNILQQCNIPKDET